MKSTGRRSIYYLGSLVVFTFFTFASNASVKPLQTCVPPPSGLVSWWPGDGNANDITDGNNGILVNGATFAPGLVGQAFSLDGTDDAVEVPNAPNLNPTQQITIDALVYPTATSGDPDVVNIIVNKEELTPSGTIAQYEIGRRNTAGCSPDAGIPTGNLAFFLGGVSGLPSQCRGWVDGGAFLPLNTWSHVALTFDGAAVRTYVNGILSRDIPVSGTLTTTNGMLRIGARNQESSEPVQTSRWAGEIDELEIFNRALTASEIQAIFNAGSAGKCKSTAEEFIINITTFIPGNNMSAFPRFCRIGSAPFSRSLFVKTDDRSFDPNAVTYRTRHTVTVIPDESVDPDGIKGGTGALPLTQATRLYARDALPVIDQDDDDGVLGDCSLLHAIEFPLVNNAQITPFRIGPKQVRVRLRGDVGTGAAFGLGLVSDISWDVTLEIDTSGPSPRVTIQGRHDGFPAYEIYVNNQEIYTHNPGSPPYNFFDLLKLFHPMEVSIPRREKIIQ